MKAETKAKRRATLSICGLGFLDETEIEIIPNARPVTETTAPRPQIAAVPTHDEETGEVFEEIDLPPADPLLSAEQAGQLIDLMESLSVPRAEFLKWAKVQKIEDIEAAVFTSCVHAIKNYRAPRK